MQKDQTYHESAIKYNEGLAEFAETLAPTLEHEEVRKWCTAVGKQHRFHAKRHRSALNKLLLRQESPPVEVFMDGMDVPDPENTVTAEVTASETEVEEIVERDDTLSDGCSPYHNPIDPNCQFHPKGDDNG
jgi:hypothetical protein